MASNSSKTQREALRSDPESEVIQRLEHNIRVLHGHVQRKRATILEILSILKGADTGSIPRDVATNIRTMLEGVIRAEPMLTDVERALLERDRSRADAIRSRYPALSGDEVHVCLGVMDGLTTDEIACEMCKSAKTIDTYRQTIRQVIGLTGSRMSLAETLAEITTGH